MKLLKYETYRILKNHYKGFIILLILNVILICLYNAIYYNSEIVTNAIANTEPKVLKIFDISKDKFTTINGYFIFIVKVIEIIFSLYALKIGIQMASYDKKTNTRDFLYTKPKKRNTTIINRIISSAIVLALEVIAIYVSSIILFVTFRKEFNVLIILLVLFSMYLIALIFYSLGLVIGGFKNGKTPIIVVSTITIVIFIIIHILDILFNIKFLYYLNPFSYFNISEMLSGGSFPLSALLIALFMLVFFISFGISIYESNNKKRDTTNL